MKNRLTLFRFFYDFCMIRLGQAADDDDDDDDDDDGDGHW